MGEVSRHVASFHIAGFEYYEGACVFDELRVGKTLTIVAEPHNPHDSEAVAIRLGDSMLGYVPRKNNGLVSKLLRFGHEDVLECRIQQVNPAAHPNAQIRVGLYVADAREPGVREDVMGACNASDAKDAAVEQHRLTPPSYWLWRSRWSEVWSLLKPPIAFAVGAVALAMLLLIAFLKGLLASQKRYESGWCSKCGRRTRFF